jgi:type II secretory pathway pseudopilin PulG
MWSGPSRAPVSARAFSLVELIAVLAMVGALSIAAAPALRTVQRSSQQAAAGEVGRTLIVARRCAMSRGEPAGARVDLDANSITLWMMPSGATAPVALKAMDGADRAALVTSNQFGGVEIESMRGGDGAAGDGEIWFSPTGEPLLRDGDSFTPFIRDAEIALTGDATVVVRKSSGAVQW